MGRQAYIVFPLIEESEHIDLKNLEDGYETLRQAFPEFKMSKVHGKIKPKEKEEEIAGVNGKKFKNLIPGIRFNSSNKKTAMCR